MSKARESSDRRTYKSPLRSSQRDATRRAIVSAAYELIRSSPESLTVPAIAARAGVSVPTVNRHFPSRQALHEGVVAHLDALAEVGPKPDLAPEDVFGAGLGPLTRELFVRFAAVGMPPGTHAAISELRARVTIPRRRKLTDDAIARVLPTLREPHRTWLSDLVVVVLSSSMVGTMQSYLGHPPEENARRVEWMLATLFAEARRLAEGAEPKSTRAAGRAKRPTRASEKRRKGTPRDAHRLARRG